MNKREFVLRGCAGLLGGSLAVAALADCQKPALPPLPGSHSLSDWRALVGQCFEVQGQAGLSLQLLAVQGDACAQPQEGLQQFHLSFALQGPRAAAQAASTGAGQILRLLHKPSAQETGLFLQAAAPSAQGGERLQATFSLLA